MIDKIRDLGYKKVTGIVLLGLICLVFVFLGAPTQQLGIGAAAIVNNKLVSVGEYQRELQRLEERYSRIFGGDLGSSRQFIRSAALENLISRQVVAQGVEEEGLKTTDLEVKSMIVEEIPAFKEDGRFRKALYERYLQSSRLSPGKFEDLLRFESLNLRTRRMFELVMEPTKEELQREIDLKSQKVNLSFVKLDKSQLQKKLKVSSKEVVEKLSDESFRKKVGDYYNKNKSEFEQDEEVRVRHILIKAKKGDKVAEKAALGKIKEIQEKISNKESFAKLAQEYSEDPGSKKQQGDLGFFSRGRMVPEFEKAAFSLKNNQVSEPVQTSYGYHLIKVLDKKEAKSKSLKSQEKSIAKRLIQEIKIDGNLSQFQVAVEKGSKKDVSRLVKKWGLKWQETGEFDKGSLVIPKVGEDVEALKAVFALSQGELLSSMSAQGGARYILKVKSRSKDSKVNSQKGRKELKGQLTQSLANEAFNQWLEVTKKGFKIEKNTRLLGR